MAKSFIYSFIVNMQDFKKDMKQNYFLEHQIVQEATFRDFQLPPANSYCDGQVGNCLFLTMLLNTSL